MSAPDSRALTCHPKFTILFLLVSDSSQGPRYPKGMTLQVNSLLALF